LKKRKRAIPKPKPKMAIALSNLHLNHLLRIKLHALL
jgi:hypothetical protein